MQICSLKLHRETAGFSRISYGQDIMDVLDEIFRSQDHSKGAAAILFPRSNMSRLSLSVSLIHASESKRHGTKSHQRHNL
jgi:hypothetical protein